MNHTPPDEKKLGCACHCHSREPQACGCMCHIAGTCQKCTKPPPQEQTEANEQRAWESIGKSDVYNDIQPSPFIAEKLSQFREKFPISNTLDDIQLITVEKGEFESFFTAALEESAEHSYLEGYSCGKNDTRSNIEKLVEGIMEDPQIKVGAVTALGVLNEVLSALRDNEG